MGWALAEKRQSPRIEVFKLVDVMTRYIYFTGSILNVSSKGLFIKTNNPLPEGTELEVVLHLGEDREPYTFKGVVSWKNDRSAGPMPAGMGIKITSGKKNLLKELGAELMASPRAI
jgi:Tfp pilus assembly protein PilZ